MRRFLAACLLLLLLGCGDKAKDLYDTAQLEEKQFQQATRYETISADLRRISQLALRESGEDSFGGVGESALDIGQVSSKRKPRRTLS
jgi:hypothetical protein